MSVFLKLALPVKQVSLLFRIQNPTMIHQATIDLVSKVMYLQSIICEKVFAMSLHQFFLVGTTVKQIQPPKTQE